MASSDTIVVDSMFPPPRWLDTDASYFEDGTVVASQVPPQGIVVGIDPYPGMAEGDLVRMYSVPVGGNGQAIAGAWERLDDTLRPQPSLRAMTLAGLSLEADEIDLHYQVLHEEVLTTSLALRVALRSGHGADRLEAPFIVQPNPDGVQPTDVSITLRANVPSVWQGGSMDLYLLGTAWTCHTTVILPQFAKTRTVVFRPMQGFDPAASAGGLLRAWYTMTREDSTSVSGMLVVPVAGLPPPPEPLPLVLGGDASIDAEPFVVAIASATPLVAPDPPDHATLMRSATGGTPPYRYETSNPRVAAVDGQGKVTATGNGTASIRVVDADGAVASCAITITGVTVLMPVRTQPHVGADCRQNLVAAGQALASIWFMPGVMAQLHHLRALWRQHKALLPGLAGKIGFDEEDPARAYYWVFDSSNSTHFRINLNAADESGLVETMPFGSGETTRHFVAMVETNMWNGFNDWYRDGEHASVRKQPFYLVDYGLGK